MTYLGITEKLQMGIPQMFSPKSGDATWKSNVIYTMWKQTLSL